MANPFSNGSGAARMRALEAATQNVLAGWQERINVAAASANLPSGLATRLSGALDDAIQAIGALLQAKDEMVAKRASADTNRQFGPDYYKQAIQQISDTTAQQAWDALDRLRAAAADVQERIAGLLRIKKPAGASDVLLVDRKADLAAELTAPGQPQDAVHLVERAARLLRVALEDSGNDDAALSAYVLAGGFMDTWLRGHGVSPAMQAAEFASAIGSVQSRDGSEVPGAAVIDVLTGNGEQTLQTFVSLAQQEITGQVQALQRFGGEIQVTLSGLGGTATNANLRR